MHASPVPARRWTPGRTILVVLGVAGVLLFGAITLTIPAIAATAPALLTLGAGVLVWAAWPKRPK